MEKGKKAITIVIFFVSVMLVALIFIQFRTVEESNLVGIETMQEEELRSQIAEWKNKYEELNTKIASNKEKIEEYTNTIQNNMQASELLDSELNEYNMLVGKTNVVGNGVIINLTDSFDRTYTSSNLTYIINELKYAGAEAISVNGERIINMTDIVTIQDRYILVNGRRISGPYEMKVIGNQEKLNEILNFPKDGLIDDYRNLGYTIDMNLQNNIHIPAYNGEIEIKYMKEVK